ncbi:3-methyladenine DNA glycosylase, partial [Saccharothrix sp. MB29]|nr:3-methyladenine DNA glycosylase [Saccharothrix sp. MB29]
FTPDARPRNTLQPTRETQVELEQPGCLHANMDLFKWAYKLDPATPSELVADCFELAARVRELDMRASPYDLSALGYGPVAVETAEGRAEYVRRQAAFAEESGPPGRR